MTFHTKSFAAYVALISSLPSLVESSLRVPARDLTVCDTLKACYLVNIQTRKETELGGSDTFALDPLNDAGYSIRCDVNGDASLDFIKFFYESVVQDEFGLPRYMYGDSNEGSYINKVDYLSTCGKKTLRIQGHVWSNMCFEKNYIIDVINADGKPCGGVPTNAPVKPPTKAPVKPPTKAPVKPPTNAPVKPPTKAPVKPPTKAPVKPPTKAPVKPPTNAPVKPPVKPNCTPVRSPVPPPAPVCPYPQEWVNGSCKNTCRNDYVCPSNSCRVANRLCYDSFDDCQCNWGYVKSLYEDKCIRQW